MADEMLDSMDRDEELSRMLARWPAPAVPESLDERVLARYRRDVRKTPVWMRFFTTSVRVPLPIALAALILLLVSTVVALRRPADIDTAAPLLTNQDLQLSPYRLETAIVSRTTLAGFEPVSEMNISVVREPIAQ
jgi:hypothetical protein